MPKMRGLSLAAALFAGSVLALAPAVGPRAAE